MPIYEFHCKDCRSDFRALRRTDSVTDVRCPTCGERRVTRLLSVTAAPRATAPQAACASPAG